MAMATGFRGTCFVMPLHLRHLQCWSLRNVDYGEDYNGLQLSTICRYVYSVYLYVYTYIRVSIPCPPTYMIIYVHISNIHLYKFIYIDT